MPVPSGRDLILYLQVLALTVLAIAAGITGSRTLLSLTVIAIGLGGITVAVHGKPERVWGLTDRLLHRLPEPAWRAVVAGVGLAIAAGGVLELALG